MYHLDLKPGACKSACTSACIPAMTPRPILMRSFCDASRKRTISTAFAPAHLSDDARMVQRQAFAGLLWSKQFYHYVVEEWLKGDPAMPPPPPERSYGRNRELGSRLQR